MERLHIVPSGSSCLQKLAGHKQRTLCQLLQEGEATETHWLCHQQRRQVAGGTDSPPASACRRAIRESVSFTVCCLCLQCSQQVGLTVLSVSFSCMQKPAGSESAYQLCHQQKRQVAHETDFPTALPEFRSWQEVTPTTACCCRVRLPYCDSSNLGEVQQWQPFSLLVGSSGRSLVTPCCILLKEMLPLLHFLWVRRSMAAASGREEEVRLGPLLVGLIPQSPTVVTSMF